MHSEQSSCYLLQWHLETAAVELLLQPWPSTLCQYTKWGGKLCRIKLEKMIPAVVTFDLPLIFYVHVASLGTSIYSHTYLFIIASIGPRPISSNRNVQPGLKTPSHPPPVPHPASFSSHQMYHHSTIAIVSRCSHNGTRIVDMAT